MNQCHYLSPNQTIDNTHHLPAQLTGAGGVIGCGLVEAMVHFVPEITVELETLEDGEEQPHKVGRYWGILYHDILAGQYCDMTIIY